MRSPTASSLFLLFSMHSLEGLGASPFDYWISHVSFSPPSMDTYCTHTRQHANMQTCKHANMIHTNTTHLPNPSFLALSYRMMAVVACPVSLQWMRFLCLVPSFLLSLLPSFLLSSRVSSVECEPPTAVYLLILHPPPFLALLCKPQATSPRALFVLCFECSLWREK